MLSLSSVWFLGKSNFLFIIIINVSILVAFLGLRYGQCESEGEIRGRLEEGDQEASTISRSDQDLDSVQRDQGQEGSVLSLYSTFMFSLNLTNIEYGYDIDN